MGADDFYGHGAVDLSYVQEQLAEERELAKKLREKRAEKQVETQVNREMDNKFGVREMFASFKKEIVKGVSAGVSAALLTAAAAGPGLVANVQQQRNAETFETNETHMVARNLSERSGAAGDGDKFENQTGDVTLNTEYGPVYMPQETYDKWYESYAAQYANNYPEQWAQQANGYTVAQTINVYHQEINYYDAPDIANIENVQKDDDGFSLTGLAEGAGGEIIGGAVMAAAGAAYGRRRARRDQENESQANSGSEEIAREQVDRTTVETVSDDFELSQ